MGQDPSFLPYLEQYVWSTYAMCIYEDAQSKGKTSANQIKRLPPHRESKHKTRGSNETRPSPPLEALPRREVRLQGQESRSRAERGHPALALGPSVRVLAGSPGSAQPFRSTEESSHELKEPERGNRKCSHLIFQSKMQPGPQVDRGEQST